MNKIPATKICLIRVLMICSAMVFPAQAGIKGEDDFNDNSLDPTKWTGPLNTGQGTIEETGGRLEFVPPVKPTNPFEQSILFWGKNAPDLKSNWNVTLDLTNSFVPKVERLDPYEVLHNSAEVSLSITAGSGSVAVKFVSEKFEDDAFNGISCDISGEDEPIRQELDGNTAAVKIAYDHGTRRFTIYYDSTGALGGYFWVPLGSASVDSWGVANGETAGVTLSMGYSGDKVHAPSQGDLSADNFRADTTSNTPPRISAVPGQTIARNTSTAAIPFTVDDFEEEPASLTVTARSSDPAVIPVSGVQISGEGRNRTVKVTPNPGTVGTVRVTLVVSDGTEEMETGFPVVIYIPGAVPDIQVEDATGKIFKSEKTSLRFGHTKVSNGKVVRTLRIKNVGKAALKKINVSVAGTNKGSFSIVKLPPASLQPKKSAVFDIAFRPKSKGSLNASLRIASNDPDENPFIIPLRGTGE